MRNAPAVVAMFQQAVRDQLPELATGLGEVREDSFGNYTVLQAPWPANGNRCGLEVTYRGDCFEVAFFVAEARGPAEQQIIAGDSGTVVKATIDFLEQVVRGGIVVDVLQYYRLSSEPYYLAFFREFSRAPGARTVDTIRWVP